MKLLVLAALVATSGMASAPVVAMETLVLGGVMPADGVSQPIERRSGRCPGGESRPYVRGCSGV
jgi:hypothetical protein